MKTTVAAACLVAILAGATRAHQAPNGAIGGVVIGPDEQPLRRVLVTLTSPALAVSRVATTDDAGRFLFEELAAGSFHLTASRPGYLTTSYGSTRGWRSPGLPVALKAGERTTNLTFRLPKGGVITGRVTDPRGQPLEDLWIQIREVRSLNGQLTYVAVPANDLTATATFAGAVTYTDDRGVYRIYGLPPGTFVVSAYRIAGDPLRTFEPTTGADLDWARATAAGANRPSGQQAPRQPDPAPSVGYVPIYFPGTADPAAARPVTLEAGEERAGVDFPVEAVRFATISGQVSGPSGEPASGVRLYAASAAGVEGAIRSGIPPLGSSDAQGNFTIRGVPSGRHSVLARGKGLFGQVEVEVRDSSLSGVNVQLLPGVAVTGRVVIDNRSPLPADVLRARVVLVPPPSQLGAYLTVPPVELDKEGGFKFDAVGPGTYSLSLSPASGETWMISSMVHRGRSLLNEVLEVSVREPIAGVTVTVTDRVTEISGLLLDQSRRPAPDFYILAYPADRRLWSFGRERLRPAVRPDPSGRYRIVGLPAGEYLLAAVTEMQPNDFADPMFLDMLVPGSIKISLAEGEKKTQDVMLAGGT